MADVKYIKIPTDFFDREPIAEIMAINDSDSTVLLYIELVCAAYKKNRKGIFSIANIELTDDVLHTQFPYTRLIERLSTLEEHGLIKRNERGIEVFKFWQDKHDRNSARYREWRKAVFDRDGYECSACGTRENLQAHHIAHWKDNKKLRYAISNGITLCRSCHLVAHGGSWRSG